MSAVVVIVAGGSPKNWPELSPFNKEAMIWVGVDRGAWYLLEHGILPTLAIGDFDSLNASELAELNRQVAEVQQAPKQKDDTDVQLALSLVKKRYQAERIVLIGATGGRLDHFLVNLWVPLEPRFQAILPKIEVKDAQNSIRYYRPGTHEIKRERGKEYLGFICLTPVTDLTLLDTKYRLTHQTVAQPTSYGSNEFLQATAHFSFASGVVAVIQSKDA